MAILNFDARTVAPDTGVQEALPAGWYNVMIDQSEIKPTKANDGNYLELCFKVLDGAHVGKSVFGRLNLRNANPTAQEIGYKQLSAVAHAVGVLMVQDSSQLHNIPLKIKLKVRPARDDYEASNDITAYKNINEVVEMPGAAPAFAQAAPVFATSAPAFAQPAPAAFAPAAPAFAAPAQPWDAGAVAAGATPASETPPWAAPGQAAPGQAAAPQAPVQQQQAPVAPAAPPWAQQPAA